MILPCPVGVQLWRDSDDVVVVWPGTSGAGRCRRARQAGSPPPATCRRLHRELKPALCQRPLDDRLAAGLTPETVEDQRRPGRRLSTVSPSPSRKADSTSVVSPQAGAGLQELVELAARRSSAGSASPNSMRMFSMICRATAGGPVLSSGGGSATGVRAVCIGCHWSWSAAEPQPASRSRD